MSLSLSQFATVGVVAIAIAKGTWDFWLSPKWKKKRMKDKSGTALTDAIERGKQFDGHANSLAFLSITVLSIFSIYLSVSTRDVSWSEYQRLCGRVAALEHQISAENHNAGGACDGQE